MIEKNRLKIQMIAIFLFSALFIKALFSIYNISSNSIYIVISTLLLIIAIKKLCKFFSQLFENKKMTIVLAIYSFLISIAIVVENKIVFTGEVGDTYLQNIFLPFEWLDILKFLLVFLLSFIICINIGIIFLHKKLGIIEEKKENYSKQKNALFWLLFTILTVVLWLPFFLTYAPGAILGDSTASIAQGLDFSILNNHHPIVYSMYVGIFMRIGKLINNYNLGVALYSFTQLSIMASAVGYAMLWLKKHNVKLIYILLSWLYFVSNTIFAKYAIIMWKDPLFCTFLFFMMLLLFDIVKSNGEVLNKLTNIIKYGILSLLIAFFRNNGFIIVSSLYIIILLVFRKKTIKYNVIMGIIVIGIALIQGPVYNKLNIVSPFEESIAIPLQQIARTVVFDGKITAKQKEYIENLYSEEDFKETYEPMIVDSIKWNAKFNKTYLYDNKIDFFKTWTGMLIPNFNTYVKAYLMNTLGFWSTHLQNWYGFADTYIFWEKQNIDNGYNIHSVDLVQKCFKKSIKQYFKEPTYIGSGTLFWIMLFVVAVLIIQKNTKYIISLLPGILTWISIMISTPVAFSLRYVFVLVYALPIMIMIPFIANTYKKERIEY